MKANRVAYGETLDRLAFEDDRIVIVDADLMNVVVDHFGRDVDAVPSDDGRTATVTVPVVTPCLSGFSRHMEDGVAGKGHRLTAGYAHDELGVVIVGKEAACIIARCI